MKSKYLEIIYLTIIISFISISVSKYENSNLKKFLSNLGLPDIPESKQFLEEQASQSEDDILSKNETIPSNSTDDDEPSEEEEFPDEEEEDSGEEEKSEEDPSQEENQGDKSYINIRCLWVDKYNVYSLQKLQNDNNDYVKPFINGKIYFNFCKNTKLNKESTVIWEKNYTNSNLTSLIKLSGNIDGDEKNKNEWMEINDDDERNGLKIKLTHGELCTDKKYHQTYFKIYCTPKANDSKFLDNVFLTDFNEDACIHYITIDSIYGCALNDWYLLKRVMSEYWYIFSAIFILLGLFLCLFGYRWETITLALVLGVICCYLVSIIVLNFLSFLIDTEKKLYILLGVGFLVGVVLGYMLKTKMVILTIMLGASMGYSLAEFVYQIIQGFIDWNPTYLYYTTIVICVVAGILAGLFVLKSIIIIGTSLLGGYIAMRGVTIIFGNYIDEGQFVDLIKNGEFEQLKELQNGWTYAYLGLWLVLTVFGTYYQCYGYKKSDKNSSNNENYKPIK